MEERKNTPLMSEKGKCGSGGQNLSKGETVNLASLRRDSLRQNFRKSLALQKTKKEQKRGDGGAERNFYQGGKTCPPCR